VEAIHATQKIPSKGGKEGRDAEGKTNSDVHDRERGRATFFRKKESEKSAIENSQTHNKRKGGMALFLRPEKEKEQFEAARCVNAGGGRTGEKRLGSKDLTA